jgi:hypothetical protein
MPAAPRDICKGFRDCYASVLKAVVANDWVAGVCMGIPTYVLLFCLLWKDSVMFFPAEYVGIQSSVSAPFYTLLAFTAFAWLLELIGIRWMMPALIGMCAFCHAAVGSWWLVNFCILGFAGWSYIPLRLMVVVLLGFLTPAIVWHITGDILRAYKERLIEDIALAHTALLASATAHEAAWSTADMEKGAQKDPV